VKEKLDQRLQTLMSEYEAGQKMLAELDSKRANLTQTLLRIEGAIQMLRELLGEEAPQAADSGGTTPAQ
jgi:hypothetical protein